MTTVLKNRLALESGRVARINDDRLAKVVRLYECNVEDAIQRLWIYVRENQQSLSREVAFRMMNEIIAIVTEGHIQQVELLLNENTKLTEKNEKLAAKLSETKKGAA